MILHLLAKSPIESVFFDRLGEGDGVLLQSANIWLAGKGHQMAEKIQQLLVQQIRVYVLSEDLELFGLAGQQLLAGVQIIDMRQMVDLTISYSVVKTWR